MKQQFKTKAECIEMLKLVGVCIHESNWYTGGGRRGFTPRSSFEIGRNTTRGWVVIAPITKKTFNDLLAKCDAYKVDLTSSGTGKGHYYWPKVR